MRLLSVVCLSVSPSHAAAAAAVSWRCVASTPAVLCVCRPAHRIASHRALRGLYHIPCRHPFGWSTPYPSSCLVAGWLVRCAVREGIALSVLEDREKRTRAASTHKTTPRTGPARKSLEESLLSRPISLRPWFPRCRRGPDKGWFYTGQGWRQRLCASHRSLLATATSIPLEPQPRRR